VPHGRRNRQTLPSRARHASVNEQGIDWAKILAQKISPGPDRQSGLLSV
jgi:hypothetical protein